LGYHALATVLYHEIGHHIHAVHKPVHEGRENVADKWKNWLCGRFLRRHYWYAMPLLFPVAAIFEWAKRLKFVRLR
jgi:hypothetical protein